MFAHQAILEAASSDYGNPVDYYAGVSALCVVIMFAKFTTHESRRQNAHGASQKVSARWRVVHIASVALAALGALVSLVMLGWGDSISSSEGVVRPFVIVFAMLAALLLAVDLLRP